MMAPGYFVDLSIGRGVQRYFVPAALADWASGVPLLGAIRTDISLAQPVARSLSRGLLFASAAERFPRPRDDAEVAWYCRPRRLSSLRDTGQRVLDAVEWLAKGLDADVLQQAPAKLGLSATLPRHGLVWIGSGHSLHESSWICPEPSHYERLAEDFMQCFNGEQDTDARWLCMLHLQWTSLHPLKDGNGRLARTIVAALVLRRTQSLALSAAVMYLMVRWRRPLARSQLLAREGDPEPLWTLWSQLVAKADAVLRLSRQYVLDLGGAGFELEDILAAVESPAFSSDHVPIGSAPHPLMYRRRVNGIVHESRPYADLLGGLERRLGAGPSRQRALQRITPWFDEPPRVEAYGSPFWPGLKAWRSR